MVCGMPSPVSCVLSAQGAEGWAAASGEVYGKVRAYHGPWYRGGGHLALQRAETMAGLKFAWTSDKGDGVWTDLAAKWLENGFTNSGFRREAIPRVQVALLL